MAASTTRRRFLRTVGMGACAAGMSGGIPESAFTQNRTAGRPNIMVILADDMGYSDIGCYGGEIDTPVLDGLAGEGLRFSQFYNTARCCPTRASLLTGLYQHQAGVGHMVDDRGYDGYRGDLNTSCVTLAEVMRQAGYRTYMSGKWHVTKHIGQWSDEPGLTSKHNWPLQRGFDRFSGTIFGAGSFYDPVTLVSGNDPVESVGPDFYYTDAIAGDTVANIRDHAAARENAPFFQYVAFTAPHWPLHALDEDIARFKGRFDAGWDSLRERRRARMTDLGILDPSWPLTPRDHRVPPWKRTDDTAWELRRMEVYAAQIYSMDRALGRIIAALRETGMLDNTLILFMADNGGCAEELSSGWGNPIYVPETTCDGSPVQFGNDPSVMPGPPETYQSYGVPWANVSNTPFRLYKHWVHEGGISTPLIAHWPARLNGGGDWRNDPCHLVDVMATAVDVGEAEYPAVFNGNDIIPYEGESLVPVFDNSEMPERALFWEHEGNRAVRRGDWKLVSRYPHEWQLYNLRDDRTEMRNLVDTMPAVAADLQREYERWAARASVVPWSRITGG